MPLKSKGSAFKVRGFATRGYDPASRVQRLGFFAFADADGEIDDRADKRNQRNNSPQHFFFDTAEVLPRDIDNGPAGGQKEDNAGPDDNRCFAQADSFSSFEILKIVFT